MAENRRGVQAPSGIRFAAPTILICALIICWQITADRRSVLPPPTSVVRAGWHTGRSLVHHTQSTVANTLLGSFLGLLGGLILALLICAPILSGDDSPLLRLIRPTLEPLVVASQTVPFVALAPVFTVWFGFGRPPKVALVALITFFPITIAAIAAVDSVEDQWRELVVAFGGGPLKLLSAVLGPAAAPGILAGLRISVAYSVGAAVLAEALGASSGLGVYLERSRRSFRYDQVLAGTAVVCALSIIAYGSVGLIERWACPWLYADRQPPSAHRSDPVVS